MATPKISVIIVLYNSDETIRGTIDALNRSLYGNRELILIDNASDIPLRENDIFVSSPFNYYKLPRNTGFGAGCNYGAGKSHGEYILFLNPDARPQPNALKVLAEVLNSNKSIAAVGPQLLAPNGTPMTSYRMTPNFSRLLFSRNSPLSKIPFVSKFSKIYTPPVRDELVEVEVIPATAMMVRSSAFMEIGGFDERYFMYAEDFDLCLMLRKAGYKIYHQPKAKVYHDWGKGSSAEIKFLKTEHNKSIYRFYRKHYPRHIVRSIILSLLLRLRTFFSIIKKE